MGLLLSGWALLATPAFSPSGEHLALHLESMRAGPVEQPRPASTGGRVTGPFHRLAQPRALALADLVLARGETARLEAGLLPDGRALVLHVTRLP